MNFPSIQGKTEVGFGGRFRGPRILILGVIAALSGRGARSPVAPRRLMKEAEAADRDLSDA
jgi:hypothetical protein